MCESALIVTIGPASIHRNRTPRSYADSKGWAIIAVESDKGRSVDRVESRRPRLDRVTQTLKCGTSTP